MRDGEPCSHKGCLSHITHPCERCGRIGGKRIMNLYVVKFIHYTPKDSEEGIVVILQHIQTKKFMSGSNLNLK